MPEIHLPTKATQDLILNYVADDGVYANTSGTVASHYSTINLNITGKGVLSSIFNMKTSGEYCAIQIDGGDIVKFDISANVVVGVNIPFKQSLKISSVQANTMWRFGYRLLT